MREVVLQGEKLALFCTYSAAYTADLAHRASSLARFLIVAGDSHHILVAERDHLNQVSRAGLGTGRTAGAFLVVNGRQAVNNMEGVELAGAYAVAVTQATELARLDIRQGVGSGACQNSPILSEISLVFRVCPAVDNRPLRRPRVADLQIQDFCDFYFGLRASGGALSNQVRLL